MSERSVVVRLRAEVGNFRSDMQSAGEAARSTGVAAEQAGMQGQRGMRGLMVSAQANEQAWNTVGKGMLVAGAAILVGVGMSIAKFAEFDKAMSSVDAATHETAANMELLREKAIQVGADTAFSAVEAAQGIEELAKAGVSTKDILNGGLSGAMDLAAAGALGVGEASEIAATAMTQFKLAGTEVPHIADLLAAGAGKAQGSVQDLGMALKQSGLVASQVGLTIEETTGGLAAFASAGLIGSDAGTSFKSMLQRLTPQSKEAQKEMARLGISAYDSQGNFIGLEKFAGNLQTSMKGLTVEQRNASMATIFGSDAVRAAAVIYEKGAGGIGAWIDAVNDSGYAAETAARMQDNLAGDIEKLGGSFDTLMINSGSGPAEMLRGIVQAAEAAVDAVGQVPTPILTAMTVAAALVGGLLLLGGTFITLVPKIAATRAAMAGFSASSAGLVSGMKKIGIAGGIAALAIVGIGIALAATAKDSVYTADSIEAKLVGLAKTGGSTKDIFGEDFFKAASESSDPFSEKITSVGQALRDLNDVSKTEGFNEFWANAINAVVPAAKMTTQLKETQKAIQGMSDGLATLVQNGDGKRAAQAFSKIAAEGKASGVSVENTAKAFGTYEAALRKQADTLSVNLTNEEYYQWMLGNVPPLIDAASKSAEGQTAAAQAQAAANEETAKALAEVGLAADGTVASLGKLLEAMFATGLIQLSANEAAIKWQESLEGLDASIKKYGTSLDITTEAGKANSRALDGVAQAGISNMEAMANNGATQEELQGKLRGTYDSLVAAGGRFGMTGEDADKMARKVLGIPDNANVDTAIQNYVDSMAKLNGIDNSVRNLDGKTANVWVTTHEKSIYSEEHVSNGVGGSGGQQKATGGLIQALAGGGKVKPFPIGGLISGPGTGTSDDVPIWASSGEFMQRTAAVQKYGVPFMESVNNLTYEAPSKSLAGGYGASMSQSAYSPVSGGQGSVSVSAPEVRVYIGNEQIDARIEVIAGGVANRAVNQADDFAGRRRAR
ncbi:phage tail tape measure protein [Arthrobacter sp. GMC3]|uniref:phage tail tape measure protein n=1 Tax=Arthrobacter sp. GMC3 TaxID=2058894 RepID=UPI000CE2F863|nr:phage tail tape measure protein [Arthrobacter sp. GMC3]